MELLAASVENNVDTVFHAVRYEIPMEKIEPPTAALEYARRMAQRALNTILDGIGMQVQTVGCRLVAGAAA